MLVTKPVGFAGAEMLADKFAPKPVVAPNPKPPDVTPKAGAADVAPKLEAPVVAPKLGAAVVVPKGAAAVAPKLGTDVVEAPNDGCAMPPRENADGLAVG